MSIRTKLSTFNSQLSTYKFHLLLFFLSFLILTKFNIDPDLGWHLAIGERFLKGGEIVRGDPFSWTMPGYEFGNYFFLYQIVVTFLFVNVGHILTAIVFGAIASFFVLVLVPKELNFWKMAAVVLGVLVTTSATGIRPSTISFIFFTTLLVLLEKKMISKISHVLFYSGFFAVWANFHQGFMVGLLIMVVFLTADFFWRKSRKEQVSPGMRAMCILAGFAGSLVTPFHASIWRSAIFDLVGSNTWRAVAEWQSLVFYFPANLIYGLSGLIFIYIFFKKFKSFEPAWALISAFLFTLPFLATTFAIFWAAIFIFFVSRNLDFKLDLESDIWVKAPILIPSLAFISVIFLSFVVAIIESRQLTDRLRIDNYPVEAVNYLKEEHVSGRLFNDYGWGGYIIWQAPELKVFIDGRMTGWRKADGSYILADYVAIARGGCGIADKYQIETVLITKDLSVPCFANWQKVYEDQVAKVLVKPYADDSLKVDRLR